MIANGIYKVRDQSGEISSNLGIEVRDGMGRGVRLSTANTWMWQKDFVAMSDNQIAKLTEYGLHDNQSAPAPYK